MGTKNFLSILRFKSAFILVLPFFFLACSQIRTREQIQEQHATPERPPNIPEALRPTDAAVAPSTTPAPEATPTPESSHATEAPSRLISSAKIGLILGPGSVRAFAHVGVVQELAKAKLPITHVVGFETGALVGAIFAQKGQPFDVEWQMFKMKDFRSLGPFLQTVFQNQKTEDFKISFACPAYNLVKQQNFMMNKGPVTQMLPYCLPSPPLLKAYNQNVAGVTELKAAIDYLHAKGANYIVYVHVLSAKAGVLTGSLEDESNIYWSLNAQSISHQWQSVDYVITVPVQDEDLLDFSKRREMLQKGLEAGQAAASQIARRLGL